MSEALPTREQAIGLLRESGCSDKVINHCIAVAKLAVETAEALRKKGFDVNVLLVEIGGLLHDLGRSKTHSVNHAVVGVEIAKSAGLPELVISIIKRHVGGGITHTEAKQFGWPTDDNYIPTSLEEKLVSYADKLIAKGKRVSIDRTLKELSREGKVEAAMRVLRLHEEIKALLGDQQ